VLDPETLAERASFLAYAQAFTGGESIASGDINQDGVPDIITAPGRGGGPQVRVFDGLSGNRLPAPLGNFLAYSSAFTGGVNVATGDINGDGWLDIITVPGPGGGPQVRVFSGRDGVRILGFFAYANTFTNGLFVAAGDIDGDGRDDIITAPATGTEQVKVFSGLDGSLLRSFFPYSSAFGGGVYLASGDINDDGRTDIITGPGRGGGPQVRAFSGVDGTRLASFFAYPQAFTGGVRVASADMDGDGHDDFIVGAGPGGGPQVRTFSGETLARLNGFFAYATTFTGGVFVAGGPLQGQAAEALRLAASPLATSASAEPLTQAELEAIHLAALARWQAVGLSDAQLDRISRVRFDITDLPGDLLGLARANLVQLDRDAAGHGWFIDPTPDDDLEFLAQPVDDAAIHRVDLLTAVLHELGHLLGLDHLDAQDVEADLMHNLLATGTRRLPSAVLSA
jgi:hypothetical protein